MVEGQPIAGIVAAFLAVVAAPPIAVFAACSVAEIESADSSTAAVESQVASAAVVVAWIAEIVAKNERGIAVENSARIVAGRQTAAPSLAVDCSEGIVAGHFGGKKSSVVDSSSEGIHCSVDNQTAESLVVAVAGAGYLEDSRLDSAVAVGGGVE